MCQRTCAPDVAGAEGPATTSEPSALRADSIMPCESTPRILAGSKVGDKYNLLAYKFFLACSVLRCPTLSRDRRVCRRRLRSVAVSLPWAQPRTRARYPRGGRYGRNRRCLFQGAELRALKAAAAFSFLMASRRSVCARIASSSIFSKSSSGWPRVVPVATILSPARMLPL